MGYDLDKLYDGPRSERRAKRKKVNRILNVLIVLVVVLIVFFGGKLIFGDKNVDESVSSKQTNQPAGNEGKAAADDSKDKEKKKEETSDKQENENTEQKADEENQEDQKTSESDESAVVTEGDPGSNIIKTVENPAWKPIGTAQAEPHSVNYTENSVDRNEMEMAASYATGFDRSDMIVWWLARNGENSITATVSSKTTKQVHKVYLDWVPGEGWRPTKVEELKENDSQTYKNYNNSQPDENEDND
ncbi:YrrS family protein [Bacillus sp. JJ1521]|uniref:YrrS family protein n=1 Tax=Bacillus sp. JJ1521 TaxID=3122957 RepID=UPI002FFFA748